MLLLLGLFSTSSGEKKIVQQYEVWYFCYNWYAVVRKKRHAEDYLFKVIHWVCNTDRIRISSSWISVPLTTVLIILINHTLYVIKDIKNTLICHEVLKSMTNKAQQSSTTWIHNKLCHCSIKKPFKFYT